MKKLLRKVIELLERILILLGDDVKTESHPDPPGTPPPGGDD